MAQILQITRLDAVICHQNDVQAVRTVLYGLSVACLQTMNFGVFMAGQPTPPLTYPPPEIAGLIKGVLTISFP